jgi:hypothetical protein
MPPSGVHLLRSNPVVVGNLEDGIAQSFFFFFVLSLLFLLFPCGWFHSRITCNAHKHTTHNRLIDALGTMSNGSLEGDDAVWSVAVVAVSGFTHVMGMESSFLLLYR